MQRQKNYEISVYKTHYKIGNGGSQISGHFPLSRGKATENHQLPNLP